MSSRPATSRTARCYVEERLSPGQVLELDLYLADPSRWPSSILEGWRVPQGSIPATIRTWGAVQLGVMWCAERDVDVSKRQMQVHYDRHVPIVPATPDDIVVKGAGHPTASSRAVVPASPSSYIDLYQKGITVGARALDILMDKVERMIESGDTPPNELLMQMGNLGVRLATSQAGIVSRGFDIARQKEEEIEGFRADAGASPRFGDHRIRVIDGEARPVVDRGRADRRAYNERAAEDGSPTLPA